MEALKRGLMCALFIALIAGCGGSATPSQPEEEAEDELLEPVIYTLSGTVTKEIGGAPLEGVTITFTAASASVSAAVETPVTTTTNAEGTWTKDGLSGTVTVTASKEGWVFNHVDIVTTEGADDVDFTDRSAIVYVSNRDDPSDKGDIWIMNIDGSSQTRLTDNDLADAYPSLSPDRSRVLYSHRSNGDWELTTMKMDGTDVQVIITSPQEIQAAWSPDGTKIAYSNDDDIFVMDADGTGAINLTNGASSCENYGPTWSPDGTRLAFRTQGCTLAASVIYLINADGSSADPFAQPLRTKSAVTEADSDPRWSPMGDFIAFTTENLALVGSTTRIHVVNTDGTGLRKLSNQTAKEEWSPMWTGDGAQIYYVLEITPFPLNHDIVIIDGEAVEEEPTNILNSPDWDSLGYLT